MNTTLKPIAKGTAKTNPNKQRKEERFMDYMKLNREATYIVIHEYTNHSGKHTDIDVKTGREIRNDINVEMMDPLIDYKKQWINNYNNLVVQIGDQFDLKNSSQYYTIILKEMI